MIERNPITEPSRPIDQTAFRRDITHTEVTWLGGAGCLVNCRGYIVLIDPILSVDPENPEICEDGLKLKRTLPLLAENVPYVDYILYTHADADHLGPLTAKKMGDRGFRFIGTYVTYHKLTQLGVAPDQIDVYRDGEEVTIGGIKVELTPADHPYQLMRHRRPYRIGDCCGFILNTPDGRLFFPGDTRLMEEHLRIKDIDLLALDVSDCRYHLGHVSAAILANNLPNAILMPVHYGTYDNTNVAHCCDPRDVYPNIENSESRGLLPAPGETVKLFEKKLI